MMKTNVVSRNLESLALSVMVQQEDKLFLKRQDLICNRDKIQLQWTLIAI